jgi:Putative excisionase (DUF1233)
MNDLLLFAESQYQAALLQLTATKNLMESVRENGLKHNLNPEPTLDWVYIDRLSEISGLTANAIRNRVSRGAWREGLHYRHERPESKKSRIIFNISEIQKCLSGKI